MRVINEKVEYFLPSLLFEDMILSNLVLAADIKRISSEDLFLVKFSRVNSVVSGSLIISLTL